MAQPQPARNSEPVPGDAFQVSNENAMLYCPLCSMKLESLKCKLFCRQCGYYMSCADYY
jgi:Zn finger protein HypA/HybF involved in hydrogenase expression